MRLFIYWLSVALAVAGCRPQELADTPDHPTYQYEIHVPGSFDMTGRSWQQEGGRRGPLIGSDCVTAERIGLHIVDHEETGDSVGQLSVLAASETRIAAEQRVFRLYEEDIEFLGGTAVSSADEGTVVLTLRPSTVCHGAVCDRYGDVLEVTLRGPRIPWTGGVMPTSAFTELESGASLCELSG